MIVKLGNSLTSSLIDSDITLSLDIGLLDIDNYRGRPDFSFPFNLINTEGEIELTYSFKKGEGELSKTKSIYRNPTKKKVTRKIFNLLRQLPNDCVQE